MINFDDATLRVTTIEWVTPAGWEAAMLIGNASFDLAPPGGSAAVPGNRRVTLNAQGDPDINFPVSYRAGPTA